MNRGERDWKGWYEEQRNANWALATAAIGPVLLLMAIIVGVC